MTINFMPCVHDADSNVWRPLDAARDRSDDFELSVSNTNSIDLLLMLGLEPNPNGGRMPLDAFAGLVTAALRQHLGQRSPEREAIEDGDRARFIICGRREGSVEDRLGDLARLVQRGRAASATHFGWS